MKQKRPTSPARAAAARANGAKSRGPVSACGKFHSSRNRLLHGKYARVHTFFDDRWLGPDKTIFAKQSSEAVENTGSALSGSREPEQRAA